MANLVNVKFNQLLSRVQGRVQGESKGLSISKTTPSLVESKGFTTTNPTLGESNGLSISKVASAPSEKTTGSTSKSAEQVNCSSSFRNLLDHTIMPFNPHILTYC